MTCIVSFRPKQRTGLFLNFLGDPMILKRKNSKKFIFAVNASLRWIKMLAAYFLSFLLITDKALRVVVAVLVIFLRRWRKICTIFLPMGSKSRYLKKCPKPCWHARYIIKSKQIRINREKYIFCVLKSLKHLKKFKKWPRPLFRPRTDHACHQTPNPSRETIPLKGSHNMRGRRIFLSLRASLFNDRNTQRSKLDPE
jgi:hypothetical protein